MNVSARLALLGVVATSTLLFGCEFGSPTSTAPDAGSGGANQCSGTSTWDWQNPQDGDIPLTVYVDGTGTSTFSLDERVTDGWHVSLIEGDLAAPPVLQDRGILANLAPGDRVELTAFTRCQPFSGCKSYVVVRDARDRSLLTARFNADASMLADFAGALGVPLELKVACAFPPRTVCFLDEVETRDSLRIGADQVVDVQRHTHAPLVIGGRKYMAWLGSASTVAGDEPAPSMGCLDQSAFWATGGVQFTLVP